MQEIETPEGMAFVSLPGKGQWKITSSLYPANKNDKYPELCVYDSRKGYNELPKNKPFARTLIPWILSWLNAYEFWLITGKWHHAEVVAGKQFN